jgi:pentatricopeptide repeat protein
VSGALAPAGPSWDAVLATAQKDFALGYFTRALTGAESVARSSARPAQRASALLVAADSAFALRDYGRASDHYAAFVWSYRTFPDAPRATMALGWARWRARDAGQAQSTWSYLADEFPQDARAPLGLMLAAAAAHKVGDRASAQVAVDRVLASYPSTPYARAGRLHHALLALDRADESGAARELADVVRVNGTAAVEDYAVIRGALATPGGEAALESIARRQPLPAPSLDRFASAVTDTRDPETAAPLLHGVVLLAATERGWADPRVDSLANRLFDDFPDYRAAPSLLARVAAAAASAGRWPIATRDYEKVATRYGDTPAGARARLELAEAFVQSGALPQARDHLRRAALAGGDESPRAWLRLAEISETMGDRREALAAYERVPLTMQRAPESLLSHARLLLAAGQADSARPLLETAAQTSKGAPATDAAYELGRLASERGQHATALRWFTSAAIAAPQSRVGQLALLGTGEALTALDRKSEALAAYTKLLAAVPVDAWRHSPTHAAEREAAGEAAYRSGTLLGAAGRHAEALNMFLMSALFTKGSPAEGRALAGVVQCYVATGDRDAAEAYYRQMRAAGVETSALAEASRALNGGAPSALPRRAR